jgi:hypothetical protein
MRDDQYDFVDWQSASTVQQVLMMVAIAMGLAGAAAWVCLRVWAGDPRLHDIAETAGSAVWLAMLCTVIAWYVYARHRKGAGR